MANSLKKGTLFVISGPSGVGKGTLVSMLRQNHPEIKLSVSATTRNPRPGEINGVHYFFLTKEDFKNRIESGEFLEWAEFSGNFYGTNKNFVEKMLKDGHNIILEIEVQGALQVKNKLQEAILIFIEPPCFEELKLRHLLVKQEQISHRTPISERSKAEVEFIEMPEFYLKQLNLKSKIKEISNKINFYPKESKKILHDWINSISIDWPISRRRFYATPIPLWYSDDLIAIPKPGEYYTPWEQSPPNNADVMKNKKIIGKVKDFKNKKWIAEERILDTWMDSSISELYILKYLSDDEFFKKAYPASLRPQGKEIVRTWLYYTILRGYLETGKPCFKDAWIHQHILDGKGRKMSKSLGNIINPQELLKEFGGEAIRMWASIEGDLSKKDLPCSKEKVQGELKTLNKLLNVSRFVMIFNKPKKPKLTNIDQLFIDYIENLTKEADESYGNYDFHSPALKLRNFLWEIYASHYVEIVKSRAYNQEKKFSNEESDSAKYTLHFLLERLLTLLYPIIPQITSTIAKTENINLLNSEFPKANKGKSNLDLIDKIMEFNSLVWKTKKEKGISLRENITGIKIPQELKDFEKDLKACHKI